MRLVYLNPLWLVTIFVKWLCKPYDIAKSITRQPARAFPEVDFLKGLSVLMVILFHIFFAVFFLFKKQPEKVHAFINEMPSWLSFMFSFDKAVDIFFMLSSFLLSYALLKVWDKKQNIHIRRFYLHRFFRIYPLFLVALLLYGLADINKLVHEGWYSLLFIENIFSKGIIPVQWSLSIEMQFYLIMPFMLIFLAKTRHPIRWLMVMISASIAMRFYLATSNPVIYQTHWYEFMDSPKGKIYMDTMYYVIESRLTPLLLGMLWAVLLWKYKTPFIQASKTQTASIWLFGLGIIYLSMRFPVYYTDSLYYEHFSEHLNLFMVTMHRIIFSATILMLVLYSYYQIKQEASLFQSLKQQVLQWKIWRLLSEVAYPMYFFHFPFIIIAWVLTLGTTDAKNIIEIPLYLAPIAFVIAILMTLYLSLWLHYAIETRFIRIGKKIEERWFKK